MSAKRSEWQETDGLSQDLFAKSTLGLLQSLSEVSNKPFDAQHNVTIQINGRHAEQRHSNPDIQHLSSPKPNNPTIILQHSLRRWKEMFTFKKQMWKTQSHDLEVSATPGKPFTSYKMMPQKSCRTLLHQGPLIMLSIISSGKLCGILSGLDQASSRRRDTRESPGTTTASTGGDILEFAHDKWTNQFISKICFSPSKFL